MNKFSIVLIGLFLCSNCASVLASDDDNADYLAAYVVDWEKTRSGFTQCQGQDSHFMLGDCPSKVSIDLYYATSALIHYTAAALLPKKYADRLKNSEMVVTFSHSQESAQFGATILF